MQAHRNVTIHNLPTPPIEVQAAFDCFNAAEHTDYHPCEVEYCAIAYDTGIDDLHRIMVIEWVAKDAKPVTFFAMYTGRRFTSLAYVTDDHTTIQQATA